MNEAKNAAIKTPGTRQHLAFWPVMAGIAAGNLVAALSSTTVTIMLPVFMKVFSADMIAVQWVITGYMLASGMVAPMIGFMADRLTLKRTYLFALVGFLAMSLLGGLAWNVGSLITFRILQGCFGGMIYPLTMSLVYQVIPREKQAFALSIWSISGLLAPTFGPTIAGLITDALGWPWVFYMNIPIALIAIVVVQKFIPAYKMGAAADEKERFDFLGLFTAIVGTFCLLFVFSNLSKWGLSNAKSLSMLVVGLVCLVVFVKNELKLKSPLLNLRVLKYRTFTLSIVILTISQIAMNASIVVLPVYLQDMLGYSATASALMLLPGPLCIFFLIPLIGKIYDKVNPKHILITLLSIGVIGMICLSGLTLTSSIGYVILVVIIRDIGVASISMPATNIGMSIIPKEDTNHASAVNSWIRQCVVSLGIGLINTFLALKTNHYVTQMVAEHSTLDSMMQYKTGYVMAMSDLFIMVAILVVLGIFAVTRIKLANR